MFLRSPAIATPLTRIWTFAFNALCAVILGVLVLPLLVIVPCPLTPNRSSLSHPACSTVRRARTRSDGMKKS